MEKNIPMANLSLETIIRECRLPNRPKEDLFLDISLKNREFIHEIFKYKKFNYDFTDWVTCYNDGEHIIGFIRPSYDDFLRKIMLFLGASTKDRIQDNEELTQKLLNRVERLKQVRTESELKEEFPYLYDDLIQGRKFINDIEKMMQKYPEEKSEYERERHYYYSCALKRRLDRFIETQSEFYTRLINHRKDYQNLIRTKSFNGYLSRNFDINKIAMYTVHTYLKICEATSKEEIIKDYLPLIEKYQTSNYDKSVSLRTNDNSIINWEMLETRIKNLEKRMNSKEALAEWELVPEGRDYSRVGKTNNSSRQITMNQEEINTLIEAGERKRTFYESTPYELKVIGLLRYKGYIGYIYSNGEVLLDREYIDDRPKSAKGDAIYHLKAADFETLSRLDKTVLRNHPKVDRIIHSKNWEEKARMIVNQENSEKEKEEAKQLIKRLKEKKA